MQKALKSLLVKVFLLSSTLITLYANDPILTKGEYISAKAHYNSGDFETAYTQFEKLFTEHSDHVYINYYLAMSGVQIGKKDEATAAFERVLIKKPDFHRARLEFAKLLYTIGFKEQAKKEFHKVLNSNVPKNVKENIKVFLASFNDEKFLLNATLMIGWDFTDNVNNGLSTRDYQLPGLANITVSGEDPKNDNGHISYVGFDTIKKIKDSSYLFKNKFMIYNKSYEDYDTADLRFYSYKPEIIFLDKPNKSQYALELSIDKVVPGEKKSDKFKAYSITPKYITKILNDITLSSYARIKQIDYDLKPSDDRNYREYKLGADFYFSKLFTGISMARNEKLQGFRTDIDKNIFTANVGYNYSFTNDLLLNSEYELTKTMYTQKDILFASKRRDMNHSLRFSFAKLIDKNNIFNLSLQAIMNSSNQSAFDYDKNSATINYIRKFQW